MRKVANFDEFSGACRFYTSKFRVNNYYGCTHPEQEETDPDEDGVIRGKCYCFSCPLGCEADIEDFDNPDIDWGDTKKDDVVDDGGHMVEGEYIIIDVSDSATTDEKQSWLDYEARLNRYNKDYKPSFEITEEIK